MHHAKRDEASIVRDNLDRYRCSNDVVGRQSARRGEEIELALHVVGIQELGDANETRPHAISRDDDTTAQELRSTR
jgi:hypothetical protein